MLILTANPQPKPHTGPLCYCRASECLSTRLLLKTLRFCFQKQREGERAGVRQRDGGREKREKQRQCEAARESSHVSFPWTFLGVTIKTFSCSKIREGSMWLDRGGRRGGLKWGRKRGKIAKLKQQTCVHMYICIPYAQCSLIKQRRGWIHSLRQRDVKHIWNLNE